MNIEKKIILDKKEELEKLYAKYKSCQLCPLAKLGRKNIVFGEGNPYSKIVFLGEGPGEKEDELCRPFVGRSGQLLTKILEIANLKREDIFITNVVKCRPPKNRNPEETEIKTCTKILLFKQLEIINPKIICTLGAVPTKIFLGKDIKITQARGKLFKINNFNIIPTYHPAYILRNNSKSEEFTNDIILIEKLSR